MDYSIAIITCHFGPEPWFFRFFLHSCSFNTKITFFLFVDFDIRIAIPENVKYIKTNLQEIKNRASETLGLSVNLDFPYKLCDFKPAYGVIFQEYLTEFDYWGQSDLDVIFGDIRSFFSRDLLDTFEFFSARHDYTTGCFTLSKNIPKINHLFKRSKDYKTVFTSAEHYCFDECNFKHQEFLKVDDPDLINSEVESFTHVVKKLARLGEIKAFFDFLLIEGLPGNIEYRKGKIFYKKRFEVLLYHLIKLKTCFNPPPTTERLPNYYKIDNTKIIL